MRMHITKKRKNIKKFNAHAPWKENKMRRSVLAYSFISHYQNGELIAQHEFDGINIFFHSTKLSHFLFSLCDVV